jgi:hypothetical protein
MIGHRWSGWPGAWCLDCGAEDPYEIALVDGKVDFVEDIESPGGMREVIAPEVVEQIRLASICREPGSKRHDPYARAEDAGAATPPHKD